MEEFDSPDAVRERFQLLCGPGAPSGRFAGVPEHDIEIVEEVSEERVRATMRVPRQAPFFADHFPRRPVFPGTLLLDAQIGLALKFTAGSKRWPAGSVLAATRVPNMKMRSFVQPGDVLELWVDFGPPAEGTSVMASTGVRMGSKTIASGKLEITARRSQ
jgi:3-hydroxymyristoyl/3-hydroxydecanoyl-(acyl carrier protein) dehydratase